MKKREMIQIADMAIRKNMDYETLYYSDYMYGKESLTEDVYEFVIEANENGETWFYDNYSKYLK